MDHCGLGGDKAVHQEHAVRLGDILSAGNDTSIGGQGGGLGDGWIRLCPPHGLEDDPGGEQVSGRGNLLAIETHGQPGQRRQQ